MLTLNLTVKTETRIHLSDEVIEAARKELSRPDTPPHLAELLKLDDHKLMSTLVTRNIRATVQHGLKAVLKRIGATGTVAPATVERVLLASTEVQK